MNILLVTGQFPQRSETFIYRKAVGLARRGHHVTVVTRAVGDWSLYPAALPDTLAVEVEPPDGALGDPRRFATAAIDALRFAARAPAAARRLFELCGRDPRTRDDRRRHFLRHLPFVGKRPDVVHFEFLGAAVMHPLVGALSDAKQIVSCRGQDVHRHVLWSEAERATNIATLQRVDAVHCVSAELARTVEVLTGGRERVWVNRPAVDISAITPRRAATTSAPLRILASGRLVWVKGFDYLLTALAALVARGVAFHAEIVGDGELMRPLRFSVEDLHLGAYVTLVGGVTHDDMLARLQTADIFVLSSVEEGISNAVLEAMAAGVPIVTTAAGGMREAVTDGVEGFVVPIRDAAQLADRLARLAGDPALRAAMGRAGRARAEADFDSAHQVENFESMYRALVEPPPPPRSEP